jgi:anti-sigma factor RsiW
LPRLLAARAEQSDALALLQELAKTIAALREAIAQIAPHWIQRPGDPRACEGHRGRLRSANRAMTRSRVQPPGARGFQPSVFIAIIVLSISLMCALVATAHERPRAVTQSSAGLQSP